MVILILDKINIKKRSSPKINKIIEIVKSDISSEKTEQL